jgi:flavorubredoxin
MAMKIKNNVYYVGKIDWELRKFHGDEFSTRRGSTYNSYLIKEEKTALLDTVWMPFAKEYVANLRKEIDLAKIDYIVAMHGEVDHSGSLPELMRHVPGKPIYCSEKAIKSLKGQYHQDWDFRILKTGDRLPLGNGKELVFVEMTMLHWPDNIMCFLTGDNILFSQDAFGEHLASESMFDDTVEYHELMEEAMKYYANILTPFSGFVTKKLAEVASLNFPIEMICPSHGVFWRKHPKEIMAHYAKWADNYKEDRIAVIYDSMWNGTRRMAELIAEGIHEASPQTTVKVMNMAHSDKNDVIVEVFRSKGIVLGSPTLNNGILTSLAALLEEMRGMRFKQKKAAAFGCYGWSGESVKLLNDGLKNSGFEVVHEGLRINWNPDEAGESSCRNYGKDLAQVLA